MGIIKRDLPSQSTMSEEKSGSQHTLKYKGFLKGHGGWVTTLAVGEEKVGDETTEFLISGSRDKTLIKWELDMKKDEEEDREWGRPRRMFSPLPFPPMTDRSSPEVSTRRSRSGTPDPSSSIPLTSSSTKTPFPASDSTMPRSLLSALPPPGTRPSRSGTTST